MDLRVGCGGWWDLAGGLPAYARRFNFVEVNTSYYRLPLPATARKWRRTVPGDFEFSVKLPRERPRDPAAVPAFLEALGARYGVVHASSPWRDEALALLEAHGYVPVLEARGRREGETPCPAGALPSLDHSASPPPPSPSGGDAYLRVFGTEHGILDHLSSGMVYRTATWARKYGTAGRERVRVVTHTVQMYEDAERIRRLLGEAGDG
ncbi:MAG: DUF72 domain-containing protein [Candidatus Thermoplasmatota archaeon]|jgi:hypothetical protein|nr:DUF72 domain-containing protein [Candidatus Thermoplasmatota archaeon]MCL5984276.1 DUF72 domain-containing protein [Candidatus Thermoplasmatota archaeon]